MSLVGQAWSNLKNNLSGNFSAVQPLGKQVQAAPVAPISQGVTSKPVPTVPQVKKTTLPTSQRSTYSPSFNAATLAQQKSLNAQGAGLKEDGIMGPKTQSAISRYSQPSGSTTLNQSTTPEAPVAPVSAPVREVDTTYQGLLKQAVEQATRAADFQNTLDQKSNDLTKQGIAMESVQGQQATLQRGYGAQAQAEASKANALANLASINRPTSASYEQAYGSPSDLAQRAKNEEWSPATGANMRSIGDIQTEINSIDSKSQSINNAATSAINYANQAGISNDSKIIAGFQNYYKGTALGNTAIAGFRNAIEQLNTQAQQLGLGTINADNATPNEIKQLQQSMAQGVARQKANLESTKKSLGNKSNTKKGGTLFGSFF